MAQADKIAKAEIASPSTSREPVPDPYAKLSPKLRERELHRVRFAPKRFKCLLSMVGDLPKDAAILDFGCGNGRNTYALLDLGYTNVTGYDIKEYLRLRSPEDRSRFRIGVGDDGRLPFDDDTFHLIISDQVFEHCKDQVPVFRELHRITRPGGVQLHVIPSPFRPVEPHLGVPFGNFIVRPWWYRVWAHLGFRGKYTHDLSAAAAAEREIFFFHEGINYISSAAYKVIWRRLGYDYRFVDQEYFDTHWRAKLRTVGKVNRVVPVFGWLKRVFYARHVLLTKPA